MDDALAHVALGHTKVPVGLLRVTQKGNRQFSIFEYDPTWPVHPAAFPIQPSFAFEASPFHTAGLQGNARAALPGVFSDAPDEALRVRATTGAAPT